ncbi:acetyltransferase [Saccharopolyspora sp. NPDC047091]|uniref:acetyltransferase n=1 Tax=Saccharopolyspora sp. NPDC047091 TaxID=3155924 RepID=UPI0033CB21C5
MAEPTIRDSTGPEEYSDLVRIWRSAVDATHAFLDPRHRAEIEELLPAEHFPQVRISVAELGHVPVGFAGTSGGSLEMLFVDAAHRGRGVGRALLAHAVAELGVMSVDVNEQNAQAVGFYLRHRFAITGRSELDDEGRPYPLLRMSRDGRAAP